MLSITNQIKLKKIKRKIGDRINKILCFIFKPLAILEKRMRNRKYEKVKLAVSKLTYDDIVNEIIKNIIGELIRLPKYSVELDYTYDYNGDNILAYIRDSKDEILSEWFYGILHPAKQEITDKLMELLKEKLKDYPEIEYYDYQAYQWSHKILVIKLKESNK